MSGVRFHADETHPQNVGLNDPLSIPDAARWVRVDEARLREAMAAANAIYTGFGPARVIAGEVLQVLRVTPVHPPRRRAPPKNRTVTSCRPLPRKKLA